MEKNPILVTFQKLELGSLPVSNKQLGTVGFYITEDGESVIRVAKPEHFHPELVMFQSVPKQDCLDPVKEAFQQFGAYLGVRVQALLKQAKEEGEECDTLTVFLQDANIFTGVCGEITKDATIVSAPVAISLITKQKS